MAPEEHTPLIPDLAITINRYVLPSGKIVWVGMMGEIDKGVQPKAVAKAETFFGVISQLSFESKALQEEMHFLNSQPN